MVTHVQQKDFRACRVFCDGKEISYTVFCWDDEAGIAYCYVPLQEIKPEKSANTRAMASDLTGSLINGEDVFLVRKMTGKIEVRELE